MKKYLFSMLSLCLFSCNSIDKESETQTVNYTKLLDEFMQAEVDVNNFSGTILVMKGDKPLLKKAYGLTDREWDVPNTIDTKYRIASNTKQFTAACILQLEEQGKLSLNDKLSKYFPGFEYGDTVTIHMLLTHSSGIEDYFGLKEFNLKPTVISKDSMVALLKTKLYNFMPGYDISYSNSGYFLLGMIVEKVSGESFENYLSQHILKVAGMNNTGIDRYDTILSNRAKGYLVSSGKISNAFDANYTWDLMFAVGSMYSTVEDMYRWDRALIGNKILTNESKKKMYFPYGFSIADKKKKADPSITMPQSIDPLWYNLGYGVWVDTLMAHKRIFSRGGTSGFYSTIYRYVNDNIFIVVLQNNEENPDRIAEPLSAILFGKEVEKPYKHKPYKINPEILKRYTGKWIGKTYEATWTIEIFISKNKLYRRISDNPDVELVPESDTKFYYSESPDKQFEFIENGNKEVNQAWFTVNGVKFRRDRIK